VLLITNGRYIYIYIYVCVCVCVNVYVCVCIYIYIYIYIYAHIHIHICLPVAVTLRISIPQVLDAIVMSLRNDTLSQARKPVAVTSSVYYFLTNQGYYYKAL